MTSNLFRFTVWVMLFITNNECCRSLNWTGLLSRLNWTCSLSTVSKISFVLISCCMFSSFRVFFWQNQGFAIDGLNFQNANKLSHWLELPCWNYEYENSSLGHKSYLQRPQLLVRHKSYLQRPQLLVRHKSYLQRPQLLVRHKSYLQRPQLLVRHKSYLQRPQLLVRHKSYLQRRPQLLVRPSVNIFSKHTLNNTHTKKNWEKKFTNYLFGGKSFSKMLPVCSSRGTEVFLVQGINFRLRYNSRCNNISLCLAKTFCNLK